MTQIPGDTLLLLSDFNIEPLANLINNQPENHLQAKAAPFGQVLPVLLDEHHDAWQGVRGAPIWTQPGAAVPSLVPAINHLTVDRSAVTAELDQFADLLSRRAAEKGPLFVVTWSVPAHIRGLGPADLAPGGVRYWVSFCNHYLAEKLAHVTGVYLISSERWLLAGGATAYSVSYWYMAKVPFDTAVFKAAASDLVSFMQAALGMSKKLVVVDLDNTLWGGVLGDDGQENIKLGGHDPVGEAFVDVQRALLALKNRGILLAVASKNEKETALAALDTHPDMVLSSKDFSALEIHWQDKAQSVTAMARQLNLGLSSVVFLDDAPAERARVAEALPQVLVPELPADPLQMPAFIRALSCFDTLTVSDEDRKRADMMAQEQNRKAAQATLTMEDWLVTLQLEITVQPLDKQQVSRAAQLMGKTNQMNLSTRRLTENELWDWAQQEGKCCYTFRVKDRFGDSGLVGLLAFEVHTQEVALVDFVLSCRVFGRGVEETMCHVLGQAVGKKPIVAKLMPTAKNKPAQTFFKDQSGFAEDPTFVFRCAKPDQLSLPKHVTLIRAGA